METTRAFVSAALARPGIRVQTLVLLRWIALGGQFITVAVVGLYFRYDLPWPALAAAIAAGAVLNVGLATLYDRNARLTGAEAVLHLGFDLVQAGVLLFLTGGLTNPFAVLLLVPVTIAATLLSARGLALMLVLALGVLVVLWSWALPLPWAGAPFQLPQIYRFGVFTGIAIGMGFIGAYVYLVSAESRRRSQALMATQAALEREGRMSALGSLAAAAAHELGGPLGTIALVAHDLAENLGEDPDFGDDIRLLEAEVARCRAILVRIARRAEAEDPFPILPLDAVLHEVARGVVPARVPVTVETAADAPTMRRTPELLHGLSNLVANAVRHAGSEVRLRARADAHEVHIEVLDDGPGFDAGLLPRLGEPFLGPSQSRSGGTGLGIFIATTLLERTGGQVRFGNRSGGGAEVDIRWPRSHIEMNPRNPT